MIWAQGMERIRDNFVPEEGLARASCGELRRELMPAGRACAVVGCESKMWERRLAQDRQGGLRGM